MGQSEIEFHIIPKRNLLGQLRYNIRIEDTLNHRTLLYSNQGYSRRIDAMKAISLIQRYAAIAGVKESKR